MTTTEKALQIIKDIRDEKGTDPVRIFRRMAGKNYISIHGPEHHIYDVSLEYEEPVCEFSKLNQQCIKERCPFYGK